MATILPGLRRAAPRLSKDFFVCRQCTGQSNNATSAFSKTARNHPFFFSRQYNSTVGRGFNSSAATSPRLASSPLGALAQTIARETPKSSNTSFPDISSKSVAYWLLGSAASVFGIVVFGGLTRLTESGYVIFPYYLCLC
jgi:cytochrome c oxidase assembly protein subunit 15